MDQLILIDDNRFLREYVWVEHSSLFTEKIPENLQIAKYKKWYANNLRAHTARIEAIIKRGK